MPAALGTTQPSPGPAMPYHAKPSRTLPRHAMPCPERFALLLKPHLSIPRQTTPSQASIAMPCYAIPCCTSADLTFSISGAVNRPNIPLFSGRQSPSPTWRPAMSNHSSSWLWSICSSSTSSSNVQDQGVSNFARVRRILLLFTTTGTVYCVERPSFSTSVPYFSWSYLKAVLSTTNPPLTCVPCFRLRAPLSIVARIAAAGIAVG